MTFAVFTEDDAGNGGNLRALEQYLCCLTAVAADTGHIGESVKCAGGFLAVQTQLVESSQKQIAPLKISEAIRLKHVGFACKSCEGRPLCRRRNSI